VDTRETRSKVPKILEKVLNVSYAALAFGDYQISDDIVFERKTFSDWEGSVMNNGHIFKQAKGLRENFKTPIFILEGGPDYSARGHARPKLSKAALHSSFLSITTGYGIPIIPSGNPTETANIIHQAVRRLTEPGRAIHVNTHKKGKTNSEIRRQIFACFPGIGPKLATELDSMPYPLISILNAIDTCQIEKLGPKKRKAINEVLNAC
jgi:Fanconi anemia group M protein